MKLGCQARSFGKGIYSEEADFLTAVGQIGKLGFAGLETNWKNLERYFQDPKKFKDILDEANLEFIGAHYGAGHWDESERDRIRDEGLQIADFVSAVGGRYIVCSGRRPNKGDVSEEMWEKTGEGLNLLGEACAPKGVKLAYHNHWWECEQDGLVTLAKYANLETVGFAFDTGHHERAGKSAAELVRAMPDRMDIIHLSDYAADAGGNVFRPRLGTGRLDLPALRSALEGFTGWLVLEEENDVESPAEQVAECIEVMRQFVDGSL
ncbi:MAG: sugar phosphate isomerase/epimerase family protein [Candidatus Latescibacteria bacterium]|jgi:sugar phosphate isomerase/epimerase|nr:sugar phosphate isomerase/epimerase family protein [Candidatus Latescibacterota bacterium]